MGWTFYSYKPINITEWLVEQLTADTPERSQTVLGTAIVKRVEAYAAVETIDKKTGVRKVSAFIAALRYFPRSTSGEKFGYKDMDETSGPWFHNMPADLLRMLTPTDNDTANAWRDECWKRIDKRTLAYRHVKPGVAIRFDGPIRFTDNYEGTDFMREKSGHFIAINVDNGARFGRYRIRNWHQRSFTVIPDVPQPVVAG